MYHNLLVLQVHVQVFCYNNICLLKHNYMNGIALLEILYMTATEKVLIVQCRY